MYAYAKSPSVAVKKKHSSPGSCLAWVGTAWGFRTLAHKPKDNWSEGHWPWWSCFSSADWTLQGPWVKKIQDLGPLRLDQMKGLVGSCKDSAGISLEIVLQWMHSTSDPCPSYALLPWFSINKRQNPWSFFQTALNIVVPSVLPLSLYLEFIFHVNQRDPLNQIKSNQLYLFTAYYNLG